MEIPLFILYIESEKNRFSRPSQNLNKTLYDTVPALDGDSHADESAVMRIELFINHYHLRLIGYVCFGSYELLLDAGHSYFVPDQYGRKNHLEKTQMKYRVYRFEINMEKDQNKLEEFLNNLKEEVVAIIPNNSKMSFFQIYGVSSKINFLFIVVKLN